MLGKIMSFREMPLMSDKKGTVLFYPYIPKKSINSLRNVLSGRWIGQGPMVDKFEKRFSKMLAWGFPKPRQKNYVHCLMALNLKMMKTIKKSLRQSKKITSPLKR